MSNRTKVVVCDKYQLVRMGDEFNTNLEKAEIQAKGIKTIRSYVEDCNEHASESGVYYKIDEKLSTDFADRKGLYSEKEFIDADVVDEEIDEAREKYKDVFGKYPHHKSSLEKIIKEIEKSKN